MSNCHHNDCFTCPYKDCISDSGPKSQPKPRRKLSPEELKMRKKEINRKYYSKNRAKISELHRSYYSKKKAGK